MYRVDSHATSQGIKFCTAQLDQERDGETDGGSISQQLSGKEVTPTGEQQVQSTGESVTDTAADDSKEGSKNRVLEEKHRKLQQRLERAVQLKDVAELEPAVEAVKKEKVPNCSELLDKVKKLSKI